MSVRSITRIALFSAILFVSQVMLAGIPNCEVVTLLFMVYTLVYGKEALVVSVVFSLMEGLFWGFGLWVIMYLYIWPIWIIVVLLFRGIIKDDFVIWSVVAGTYGLSFGFLCSLVYIPVDISFAVVYFVAGLPWDIWHGITNFIVVVSLGKLLWGVLVELKSQIR